MMITTLAMPRMASLSVPSPAVTAQPDARVDTITSAQLHNRISALMAHTTRYAFKGASRLAADAGVSKSAVCRLLNGQSSPSYALVVAITRALEHHLKRPLDPRDLISVDGTYLTKSACELAGCGGCSLSEKQFNGVQ